MTEITEVEIEVNGEDHVVKVPSNHRGGFIYWDEQDRKLVFDAKPPAEMDCARYVPLTRLAPQQAQRPQAASNVVFINRQQRRRHLALLKREGKDG